jgi:hypothetical protein
VFELSADQMPPNPPEEVIDLAVEQYSEELLKLIVQKILDEYHKRQFFFVTKISRPKYVGEKLASV